MEHRLVTDTDRHRRIARASKTLLSIAIRQGARAVELQLHTDAMTTRDAVTHRYAISCSTCMWA